MAVFGMALGLICIDILMRLCMIEKKYAARYLPSGSVAPANGFYGTFTNSESSEPEDAHEQSQSIANGHTKHSNDLEEEAPLLSNGTTTHETTTPPKPKRHIPTILVLLSVPRLLTAIYGIFVNVSILAAFDGVLPLYVHSTFHWTSLPSGLIFMCLAIPALTGPLVGRLSDRLGPRWIAIAGFILSTPPLVLLRLVAHDSLEQKILLCVLLVCCGFTLILIVSPVASDLSAVVEEKERTDSGIFGPGGAYAQAFALFNCSMAAATLFGPVAAGVLVEKYGWRVMTTAMGLFSFSGAVPAVSLSSPIILPPLFTTRCYATVPCLFSYPFFLFLFTRILIQTPQLTTPRTVPLDRRMVLCEEVVPSWCMRMRLDALAARYKEERIWRRSKER